MICVTLKVVIRLNVSKFSGFGKIGSTLHVAFTLHTVDQMASIGMTKTRDTIKMNECRRVNAKYYDANS